MMNVISQGITQVLLYLYEFSGNLGLAVLLFTLLVRSILFPITLSSLKAAHKIKSLQPELSKLKQKTLFLYEVSIPINKNNLETHVVTRNFRQIN